MSSNARAKQFYERYKELVHPHYPASALRAMNILHGVAAALLLLNYLVFVFFDLGFEIGLNPEHPVVHTLWPSLARIAADLQANPALLGEYFWFMVFSLAIIALVLLVQFYYITRLKGPIPLRREQRKFVIYAIFSSIILLLACYFVLFVINNSGFDSRPSRLFSPMIGYGEGFFLRDAVLLFFAYILCFPILMRLYLSFKLRIISRELQI